MKIGLDWDGTVTVAHDHFLELTKGFMAAGHEVYIVTMRYPSEEGEIAQWRQHVTDVVFTKRLGKKKFCEELGININIWIDDNPEAICKDGKDIWGFVTPEGFVDSHPVSHDVVIESTVAVHDLDSFSPTQLSDSGFELGQPICRLTIINGPHACKYNLHRTKVNSSALAKFMASSGHALKIPVIAAGGKIDIVDVKSIQSLDVLHKCHQVFSISDLVELNFSEESTHAINWDIQFVPGVLGPKIIEHEHAIYYPDPNKAGEASLVISGFYLTSSVVKAARSDGFAGFADYKAFLIDQVFENFKDEDQPSKTLKIGYTFNKAGDLVMWPE